MSGETLLNSFMEIGLPFGPDVVTPAGPIVAPSCEMIAVEGDEAEPFIGTTAELLLPAPLEFSR